jgi:hypothetical protein
MADNEEVGVAVVVPVTPGRAQRRKLILESHRHAGEAIPIVSKHHIRRTFTQLVPDEQVEVSITVEVEPVERTAPPGKVLHPESLASLDEPPGGVLQIETVRALPQPFLGSRYAHQIRPSIPVGLPPSAVMAVIDLSPRRGSGERRPFIERKKALSIDEEPGVALMPVHQQIRPPIAVVFTK